MNEYKIGAILVEDDGEMIGIWTERDYLRNSDDPDFNRHTTTVDDFMTSPLHFASHDATLTQLEEMFLGLFRRHIQRLAKTSATILRARVSRSPRSSGMR